MRRGLDDISTIVVHHSKTPDGNARYGIEAIDAWHEKRGFLRDSYARENQRAALMHVGYHSVIHVDGSTWRGRSDDEVGAHVEGKNQKSLGVCLIGTDRFTAPQWLALADQVNDWLELYGSLEVVGHHN